MSEDQLDDEVRELVRAAVHSFEALELLLTMHRAGERSWSSAQLADALLLSSDAFADALETLVEHGLVARSGQPPRTFKYQPRDALLASAVSQLAASCETQRVRVVMAIASNAIHRVRGGALRAFSEAMRRSRAKAEE